MFGNNEIDGIFAAVMGNHVGRKSPLKNVVVRNKMAFVVYKKTTPDTGNGVIHIVYNDLYDRRLHLFDKIC